MDLPGPTFYYYVVNIYACYDLKCLLKYLMSCDMYRIRVSIMSLIIIILVCVSDISIYIYIY